MSNEDIKKIREMMEFLVKDKISEKLKKLTKSERGIYELTGVKGQKGIIKELNVSSKTIAKVWQNLESKGLLMKEGKSYRKVI